MERHYCRWLHKACCRHLTTRVDILLFREMLVRKSAPNHCNIDTGNHRESRVGPVNYNRWQSWNRKWTNLLLTAKPVFLPCYWFHKLHPGLTPRRQACGLWSLRCAHMDCKHPTQTCCGKREYRCGKNNGDNLCCEKGYFTLDCEYYAMV